MKKTLINILKFFGVVLALVYPFVVFCALQKQVSFRFIALLLCFSVFSNFLRGGVGIVFLVLGIAFSSFLYFSDNILFFKFYPVLMNFLFAFTFLYSLFGKREPIVAKFARRMGYSVEDVSVQKYVRKATFVWGIFLVFNTMASLITVFLSDVVWTFYNGFVSYVLMACMMIGEYFVRRRKMKDVC